ncbi:MAG: DALR anticodon-binding domain-containing protein, partial [Alphaproteobacteria bacterium]
LVFFLMDVAASFHSLWSAGRGEDQLRFIVEDDVETTRARLSLLVAIRQVIRSGLGIIGVEPAAEM